MYKILSLLLVILALCRTASAKCVDSTSTMQETPNGSIIECLRVNNSQENIPYTWLKGTYYSIWEPNQPNTLATGFASLVKRTNGDNKSHTVAGQFNAWSQSGVSSPTWGVATEAVADTGSSSILIGLESLVGNFESKNEQPKIGINIVFKNTRNSTGPAFNSSKNNTNTTGLWFTSDQNTGFESGIKFDRHSVSASSRQSRPAILDLSELDPATIENVDLIKLPGGRAIYWDSKTNTLATR
jgi:hypothetical protein